MTFIVGYRGKRYDMEFDDPAKVYAWAVRTFQKDIVRLITSKDFYVIGVSDDA